MTRINPSTGGIEIQKLRIYDRTRMVSNVSIKDIFGSAAKTRGEILIHSIEEDHPGIAKAHSIEYINDITEPESTDPRYCVEISPFIPGSQLADKIPATEKNILAWVRQITQALKFLHDRGIVYRDLKPENVIISNNNNTVCLIDFQTARLAAASLSLTPRETWLYTAPEAHKLPYRAQTLMNVYKIDSYSLGVLIYTLFTGDPPYSIDEYQNRTPFMDISIPLAWRQLVSDLINNDANQRLSMGDVLTRLSEIEEIMKLSG